MDNKSITDPVVERVIKKFQDRSAEGMKRFGVTMEQNAEPLEFWIQNAQEELMDAILYLERMKDE